MPGGPGTRVGSPPGFPAELPGAASAPRRMLRPLPPLARGARGSGGSQPCSLADEERWEAGGGSWNSPCWLFRECGPVACERSRATPARTSAQSLPLEEARPARFQPGGGREPGLEAMLRWGPAAPGWTPPMPARLSARYGEHGRRWPGLGFLKISGAAPRRCDWPRPGNLYANEAAPPPRRRGPGSRRAEQGRPRWGRAGAPRARRAGTPAQPSGARASPARRGRLASLAAPSPCLPPRPSPRLPSRTTFPSDRL